MDRRHFYAQISNTGIGGYKMDYEISELVARAKGGDQEASEELIRRLQPLLISSIRRNYNNYREYEDLMQDGNLMILKSLGDYDEDRGVHFLGFIQSRLKFMYLNKHKERSHDSLNKSKNGKDEDQDLLPSMEPEALDILIQEETGDKLGEALDKLTLRQRQLIGYFYLEEMKLEDIASLLGISYRTVVNTKKQALDKMRKTLKREDLLD